MRNVVVAHGQCRYRALIDAGAAPRAQGGIGLGTHAYAITDQRLYGFVLQKHFSAERRQFEIGQNLQFSNDFDGMKVKIPQSLFFCLTQCPQSGRVAPHHDRDDSIQGHGIVGGQDQADVSEIGRRGGRSR